MNCSFCGREFRFGSSFCDNCDSWVISSEPRAERVGAERASERVGAERGSERVGAGRASSTFSRTFVGYQYDAAPEESTTYWPPPLMEEREFIPAPEYQFLDTDDDYFDFEATRMSSRRMSTQFWTLDMPDKTVEVVVGAVIVGRAATPREEFPSARLLTMNSVSRSVSKTHAVFVEESGSLVVRDLESTNGVVVTLADGSEIDLGAGGRLVLDESCTVELGDLVVKVHKH